MLRQNTVEGVKVWKKKDDKVNNFCELKPLTLYEAKTRLNKP